MSTSMSLLHVIDPDSINILLHTINAGHTVIDLTILGYELSNDT
jgi:hypothetical protein